MIIYINTHSEISNIYQLKNAKHGEFRSREIIKNTKLTCSSVMASNGFIIFSCFYQ